MIQKSRHYYSVDGTDVRGPATYDELVQLYRAGAIGTNCQLCREGGNEWQPLDPADFTGVTASPGTLIPLPPSFQSAQVNRQNPTQGGSGPNAVLSVVLVAICLLAALASAFAVHPFLPPQHNQAETIGWFVGYVIGTALLPLIVCFFFRKSRRLVAFTVAMVLLPILAALGQIAVHVKGDQFVAKAKEFAEKVNEKAHPQNPVLAKAKEMGAQANEKARKEIAEKGYADGDTNEAEKNIKSLQEQASKDNSETSRIMRAILGVTQQLIAKVKDFEVADAACPDLDAATIKDQQGIADRKAALDKLRVTQVAILTFLEHFDDTCREAMSHDNFNEATIRGATFGARKGGHIDLLLILWQHQIKLTDAYQAELDFLGKTWGHWHSKDGTVIFEEQADVDSFNKLSNAIHDEAVAVTDTQKQVYK